MGMTAPAPFQVLLYRCQWIIYWWSQIFYLSQNLFDFFSNMFLNVTNKNLRSLHMTSMSITSPASLQMLLSRCQWIPHCWSQIFYLSQIDPIIFNFSWNVTNNNLRSLQMTSMSMSAPASFQMRLSRCQWILHWWRRSFYLGINDPIISIFFKCHKLKAEIITDDLAEDDCSICFQIFFSVSMDSSLTEPNFLSRPKMLWTFSIFFKCRK